LRLKTELSVTEIAYLLGFASPAHFAQQFRRQTGVAPSELRRRQSECYGRKYHPCFEYGMPGDNGHASLDCISDVSIELEIELHLENA